MITARISKEIEFDAGHRVPSHTSRCRSPHGHRYLVRVHCLGTIVDEPGAPDDGMLIDFGDLKTLMTDLIHDPLDHASIVWNKDEDYLSSLLKPSQDWKICIFPYIPTAENIARWCWEQLEEPIVNRFRNGLRLDQIDVHETPTSVAYYYGVDL